MAYSDFLMVGLGAHSLAVFVTFLRYYKGVY